MRVISILAIAVLVSSLVACTTSQSKLQKSWLQDGSVMISRAIPSKELNSQENRSLGFVPLPAESASTQTLFINLQHKRISFTDFNGSKKDFSIEYSAPISSGLRTILLKQEKPLWYAADDYFTKRALTVPPSGSESRYLRGALGSKAIFLDDSVAIHSSRRVAEEVGGIVLSEEAMNQLYELVADRASVSIS